MHAKRGFTLIEILVVLFIMGITIGFALLAFGDFGASRRAVVNAEQLSAYIKLVQQRAIVESTALGISVSSDGYSTFRLERGLWQPMPAKSIFHVRTFPDSIVVNIQRHTKTNSKSPDIIIDAAGDISNFAIDFGTPQKPASATLFNRSDGQLLIQKPKN